VNFADFSFICQWLNHNDFLFILNSAVGNVASELKALKISGFIEIFSESSAHLHGEGKISIKAIRFNALSLCSSF
jgi:hypothetical protein